MSFSQFRISSDILRGLKDARIVSPTPLQKKIIKAIKDGKDLLINVAVDENPETGYLTPIIDYIAKQDRRQGTKIILLTPSPERAEELEKWIRAVGTHAGIEGATITEKGSKETQKSVLSSGPVIIAATPDRLAELMEENRIIFREVHYLVLDQAGKMVENDTLQVILQRLIGKHHCIATVSNAAEADIEGIEKLMQSPEKIGFDKPDKTGAAKSTGRPEMGIPGDLTQYYMNVPPRMKITTLIAHLDNSPAGKIIIFSVSRRTADRLYRVLRKSGRRAVSIHSGLDKSILEERLGRFSNNDVQHLIVGGMSAGDLTIDSVTQVINYDVPEETEEYKLRADMVGDGRAARIVSLVSKQDRSDIREIIETLGYAPEEVPLPEGVEKAKESTKGSSGGRSRGRPKGREKEKKNSDKKESGRKPRPNRSSGKSKREEGEPMQLPRPSFDKLSGGRTGVREKDNWFKEVFRKLFS